MAKAVTHSITVYFFDMHPSIFFNQTVPITTSIVLYYFNLNWYRFYQVFGILWKCPLSPSRCSVLRWIGLDSLSVVNYSTLYNLKLFTQVTLNLLPCADCTTDTKKSINFKPKKSVTCNVSHLFCHVSRLINAKSRSHILLTPPLRTKHPKPPKKIFKKNMFETNIFF